MKSDQLTLFDQTHVRSESPYRISARHQYIGKHGLDMARDSLQLGSTPAMQGVQGSLLGGVNDSWLPTTRDAEVGRKGLASARQALDRAGRLPAGAEDYRRSEVPGVVDGEIDGVPLLAKYLISRRLSQVAGLSAKDQRQLAHIAQSDSQ